MFTSEFDLSYFILLWIVRHGGEWPDWGNPFGQIFAGAAIGKIAEHVRDEPLRLELNKIAVQLVSKQAGRVAER
jgi:hypothetical protein